MKRTFCDCCGNEFAYDEPKVRATNGVNYKIAMPATQRASGIMEFDATIEVHGVAEKSGEHIDICGTCRWMVVSQMHELVPMTTMTAKPVTNISDAELVVMVTNSSGKSRAALVELQAYRRATR